jgi:hypothetical protein
MGSNPIMEIVNLEELAAEKIYEYVFFGAYIKLRGATGAPMGPVAMPTVADYPRSSLRRIEILRARAPLLAT